MAILVLLYITCAVLFFLVFRDMKEINARLSAAEDSYSGLTKTFTRIARFHDYGTADKLDLATPASEFRMVEDAD